MRKLANLWKSSKAFRTAMKCGSVCLLSVPCFWVSLSDGCAMLLLSAVWGAIIYAYCAARSNEEVGWHLLFLVLAMIAFFGVCVGQNFVRILGLVELEVLKSVSQPLAQVSAICVGVALFVAPTIECVKERRLSNK